MRSWKQLVACLVLALVLPGLAAERGITVQAAVNAGLDQYDPAQFHALLIGINEYREWSDLRSARPDAAAMAQVLIDNYGYSPENVNLITDEDATRRGILAALDSYRSLADTESLLIYYAGHGWMDEDANGFWVPSEAPRDGKYDYISNARIVNEYFKKYRVRHLLVIADSCFAGAMLRSKGGHSRGSLSELPASFRKPSRWIFTSGDLAPVEDDAGSGHSPFATRLLQFLKYSDAPAFGVNDLYVYVRNNLESEAIAQPLPSANHMPGGEYVFARLDTPRAPTDRVISSLPTVTVQPPEPDVLLIDTSDKPPAWDSPWTVPELGIELVPIRAGTFTRGSSKGEIDERPSHPVRITRQFWMGTYEVTNAQYLTFLNAAKPRGLLDANNPDFSLTFQGDRYTLKAPGSAKQPVTGIDWDAAVEYTAWLSTRERRAGRLPSGYVYRLPSEAEWEFACRAGASTPFSFGYGHGLEHFAWYAANGNQQPHDVGRKLANPWGLYDMHGNAWEWCLDWYGAYPDRIVTDPISNVSGIFRIVRGGSFAENASYSRAANRGRAKPYHVRNTIGFRLVLGPNL